MTLRSSNLASMRAWRRYFPLVSIESVTDLFEDIFQHCRISDNNWNSSSEPNLAFISIILGYIETQLTLGSSPNAHVLPTVKSHGAEKSGTEPTVNHRRRTLQGQSTRSKRSNLRSSSPSLRKVDSPGASFPLETPPSINDLPSTPHSVQRCLSRDSSCESAAATPRTPVSFDFRNAQPSTRTTADSPASNTNSCESYGNVSGSAVFPSLRFEEAEGLYQKFYSIIVNNSNIKSLVSKSSTDPGSRSHGSRKSLGQQPPDAPRTASRDLIRAVCSTLCSQLVSSRQREHLVHAQSIYSLLKTGLLDSFGLAFATVAACQLLGYADVHLALSEDHAWVEFGAVGQRETADVAVMPTVIDGGQLGQSKHDSEALTNEGSGGNATRSRSGLSGPPEPSGGGGSTTSKAPALYPPPIRMGHLSSSWLYLNGCPVVCSPTLIAAAAAITAIQPCGLSRSVQSLQPTPAPSAAAAVTDFTPPASPASSAGGARPSRPGARSTELVSSHSRHRSGGSAISSSETVSHELVRLKQSLLWVTLRAGLLSRYPLGLTNLADIEEGFPTSLLGRQLSDYLSGDWTAADGYATAPAAAADSFGQPSPSLLCVPEDLVELRPIGDHHHQALQPQQQQPLLYPLKVENSLPLELLFRAVEIDRSHYHNQHVYPYIYLANYLYRHGDVQDAMRYWAEAARVIGQYNHSSEDAEIYREFLDVATRIMPDIFKSVAMENRSCCEGPIVNDPVDGAYQPDNLLDSPLCLAYLLAFYDHLCLWEENSVVPVLHVGWVDKLMVSLTRFSAFARRNLTLEGTRSLPEKGSSGGGSSLASRSSRQTPASDFGAAPGSSPALSNSRIASPSLPPPFSALPTTKSFVRSSAAHQQQQQLPASNKSCSRFGEPPVPGDQPMRGSPAVPLVVVPDEPPVSTATAGHLDQSKSPDGRTQPLTVLLPGAVTGFQGSEQGSGPMAISPALPSYLTSSTSSTSAVSMFTAATTLSHPPTEEGDSRAKDDNLPLSAAAADTLDRSLLTSEVRDAHKSTLAPAADLRTDSYLTTTPRTYKVRKLDVSAATAPSIASALEDCKARPARKVDAPKVDSSSTAVTEDLFTLDLEDLGDLCIDAPRPELIAFLASGCEHRLLNPAFLLGEDATSPFLSPADQENLDWDQLLAEEKEEDEAVSEQLSPTKVSRKKSPEYLFFDGERQQPSGRRQLRRRRSRNLSPDEATAAAVAVSEPGGKPDLVGEEAAPPSSGGTTTGSSEPRNSFSPASSCHFSPLNIMLETNGAELGKFPDASNPLDDYVPSDDHQPVTGFNTSSCPSYEPKDEITSTTAMDVLAADATKEEAVATVEGDVKPVAAGPISSILETQEEEDVLHLLLTEQPPPPHSEPSPPAAWEATATAAAAPTRPSDATAPPTHSATDDENLQVVPPPVCHSPLAVHLRLYSVKMSSIAGLLSAPGRVNSSAIKLALTAQSQVRMRRRASTVSGPSTTSATTTAAAMPSPSVSST